MRRRPLILVTACAQARGAEFADASLSLSHAYARAIQAAGGLPLVLPCPLGEREISDGVRRAGGIMLTGGNDVQTALYASNLPAALEKKARAPDPDRDWLELALIREVFRQRKPLLAICRGMQILNVAFGGTLYVDLAAEVRGAQDHRLDEREKPLGHKILLAPHSRLAKIAGGRIMSVNSSHHQAVKELARPFQITAKSADGVAEAFELAPEERELLPYLLAVQFHPERLGDRHKVFLRLFRDFTRACGRAGGGTV